jgi:hypothetical protein
MQCWSPRQEHVVSHRSSHSHIRWCENLSDILHLHRLVLRVIYIGRNQFFWCILSNACPTSEELFLQTETSQNTSDQTLFVQCLLLASVQCIYVAWPSLGFAIGRNIHLSDACVNIFRCNSVDSFTSFLHLLCKSASSQAFPILVHMS